MAKGQLRSNREKKKPKADKNKSKNFYTGVAVGSDTVSANVSKALRRHEIPIRTEPGDERRCIEGI